MNFQKAEPWLFWCLVLLHLVPVLTLDYFVTHDGPAHVYNADLIRSLEFGGENNTAAQFFEFNEGFQPNWTGHMFLMLAGFFVSPSTAELILVAFIIAFTAFSFRYFLSYLLPQKRIYSWLVFPFLHGFLLYMGFYNFCLSVGFLFFTMGWWLRKKDEASYHKVHVFAWLLAFLYLSHLFAFLVFTVWISFSSVIDFFKARTALKARIPYIFSFFPPVLWSIFFVFTAGSEGGSSREVTELLTWIVDARPLITLHYEKQQIFSMLAGVSIIIVLFYLGVLRIKNERAIRTSDSLAFTAVFCLICYFVFPDEAATGGFVSVRFLLFFFLFSLAWIACRIKDLRMGIGLVGILLLVSVRMLWFHYHEMKRLSDDVMSYTEAGKFIGRGDVVLPLNYSDNWLHSNISCYLGAEKHALLLDNYEASKPHFPLIWKKGMEPYSIIGKFSASVPPCCNPHKFRDGTGKDIDAVILWRYNPDSYRDPSDSCSLVLKNWLDSSYILAGTGKDGAVTVYKRKIETY